jgi:hypothetical protein
MSENNSKIKIKEIFESENKIKTIHIIDTEEKLYIVYIGKKSKSIVSIDSGKIDHKEILKFIDEFLAEIENTKKDV